jgi:hypothetical protein
MLKSGEEGGIQLMVENARTVGSLIGMVKYAAKRCGSRFVVGREAWKGLVVGRIMYAAGAVGWKAKERQQAEGLQKDFGRWLWGVERSVRNGVIHGETGWSTFWEREAKDRASFLARVLENENDCVGRCGRACVEEIGVASKWWRGVVSLARKLGMDALSKGVWKRKMSWAGMEEMGFNERQLEKLRRKEVEVRIKEEGRSMWEKSLERSAQRRRVEGEDQRRDERIGRYVEVKERPRLEKFADGSDGARIRMMCRGDSLPTRTNSIVRWKYGEERSCECGEEETEAHVLFECVLYREVRGDVVEEWQRRRGEEDPLEGVLGFVEVEEDLERRLLKVCGKIWRERERRESRREM